MLIFEYWYGYRHKHHDRHNYLQTCWSEGRSWHYPERTCISNRHQPENYCQYRVKTAYSFSATANGRSLVSQTRHWSNISRNGNAMATNSFSGPAAPVKLCRMLSNGAGNRILNLMQLMTIFRKTQRHRTRNGTMPLCLFWHSFLVSAGYLPNTVLLIIKIC